MRDRLVGRATAGSVVAVLLLAACGAGGGPGPGGTGGTGGADDSGLPLTLPASLAGRRFVSTVAEPTLLKRTHVVVTFTDRGLTVTAGCNLLSGAARVEAGRLVTGPLTQTEMGCPAPLMRQDERLAALLQGRPRVTEDAGTLTLSSPEDTLTFEEVDESRRPLADTSWRLDSLGDGVGPDATVASVPPEARAPGLRLVDGVLSVRTGCGHGTATAAPEDGLLGLGPLTPTHRSCPPPLDALERHTLAVLLPGARYAVAGDVLRVTSPDGRLWLGYRAD